jgi:hypothetical protein
MCAPTNQAQAAWEIQLLGVCILVALPQRNQQRRFVCPLSKKFTTDDSSEKIHNALLVF